MNEDEIKTLRHSFTSKEDVKKISKNQFGHTVLGDIKNFDTSQIDVKLNEFGEISAEPIKSLIDSPELQNLTNFVHKNSDQTEDESMKTSMFIKNNSNVTIKDLISSLDKMDGTSESPNIHPLTSREEASNFFVPNQDESLIEIDPNSHFGFNQDKMKSCLNKDCMYFLPKDAKFCLKCGTAQMPKFCTECGFQFPGMEKFCPDCGTKR